MRTILQKIFINYLYLLWFIIGVIAMPVWFISVGLKRGLDFLYEHIEEFTRQLNQGSSERLE